MPDRPCNVGASAGQHLLNLAHTRGRAMELLLTRYALERLLHRLSLSPHHGRFVLEGAMLPATWSDERHSATREGKLVGEGFDHPPLDTLVLAMPVSWKGTLQKYAGRLHREHASNTDVRIIDFVYTAHSALLRMWDKRQRGHRAMGYRMGAEVSSAQGVPTIAKAATTACCRRRMEKVQLRHIEPPPLTGYEDRTGGKSPLRFFCSN